MSPLASAIYRQLLRRVRSPQKSITYAALAKEISKKHPVHHRGRTLYAALTEVTEACRAAHLPLLPAIVWRAGARHPSDGFFALAYPRATTVKARMQAWQRDHEAVVAHAANYPATL